MKRPKLTMIQKYFKRMELLFVDESKTNKERKKKSNSQLKFHLCSFLHRFIYIIIFLNLECQNSLNMNFKYIYIYILLKNLKRKKSW